MLFMAPDHANELNPMADKQVTLELGMVYITGPLSEIVQTANMLLAAVGHTALSLIVYAVWICFGINGSSTESRNLLFKLTT